MAPRVVFLNRYFFPDHSATSQILSDLAFHLAESGERVRVIASRQLYDDPVASLPPRDRVKGVEIYRVPTTRFGRHSLPGRMLDYLSFYLASGVQLLRLAGRGDVVVAKTDPPMLSLLVSFLSPLRGYRTVNWLHDLYPEVAVELGMAGTRGPFGRILIALRNASLRRATMNVAIGDDMARRVRTMGVAEKRLSIVTNWSDDDSIRPSDAESNPLRRSWSLEGKFVVAYSGNLGRAHDIDTLLNAAEKLRESPEIVFLCIGGGRGLSDLATEVDKRRLKSFRFEPYQPREALGHSLGVADVHWLSLKPGLDGLVLPSKFYGIAAAGRPIVIVGSPEGELAKLVTRYDCGYCIPPGRGDELARVLFSLHKDQFLCRRLGANARAMLDNSLSKSQSLARWRAILQSAGAA